MFGVVLSLFGWAHATSVIADGPACAGWRERAPLAVIGHVVGFDAEALGTVWTVVAVDEALRGSVASGYVRVHADGRPAAVRGARVYAIGALDAEGTLVRSEGCYEGMFGVLPDPETLSLDDASLEEIARAEPRSSQRFDGARAPTLPVLVTADAAPSGSRVRLGAAFGVADVLVAPGVAPDDVAVRVEIDALVMDDVVARASLLPVLTSPWHDGAFTYAAGMPVDDAGCPDALFTAREGILPAASHVAPCDTRVDAEWTPPAGPDPSGDVLFPQDCGPVTLHDAPGYLALPLGPLAPIGSAPGGPTVATVERCGGPGFRQRGAPRDGWLPVRVRGSYVGVDGWAPAVQFQRDGGVMGGVVAGVFPGTVCAVVATGAIVRTSAGDVLARAVRPAAVPLVAADGERVHVVVRRPSGPVVGDVAASELQGTTTCYR
jgi:hypothetical protein